MSKKKQAKRMMTMAMAAALTISTLPMTAYAEENTSAGSSGAVQAANGPSAALAGVSKAPTQSTPSSNLTSGASATTNKPTLSVTDTTTTSNTNTPVKLTTPVKITAQVNSDALSAVGSLHEAKRPQISAEAAKLKELPDSVKDQIKAEKLKDIVEKAPEGQLKPENKLPSASEQEQPNQGQLGQAPTPGQATLPSAPTPGQGALPSAPTPGQGALPNAPAVLPGVEFAGPTKAEEELMKPGSGLVEEAPYEVIMSAKAKGIRPSEESEALKDFREAMKALPSEEELEANMENEEYMKEFAATVHALYKQYKALTPFDRTEVPREIVSMLNYAEVMPLADTYVWDEATKTLTLTNHNGSVEELPDGSTIIVYGENNVVGEDADAIKCEGALTIKGEGALALSGNNGVKATSVSIENIDVDFDGTSCGIQVYNEIGDATVTLKNVTGSITGGFAGIYVNGECTESNASVVVDGCDLDVTSTATSWNNRARKSGITVYVSTAEKVESSITITNSNVNATGADAGLSINNYLGDADATNSASSRINITDSTVVANGTNGTWSGIFASVLGQHPDADSIITLTNSRVYATSPNTGILTSSQKGESKIILDNSILGASGKTALSMIEETAQATVAELENGSTYVQMTPGAVMKGEIASFDGKTIVATAGEGITYDAERNYFVIPQGSAVTEAFTDGTKKEYTFNNQAGGIGGENNGIKYEKEEIWGYDGEVIFGTTALKTAEWIEGDQYEITVKVPGKDPNNKHDEIIMMVDGSYSLDEEWPAMKKAINTIGETVLNGSGNTQLTLMAFGMGDNEVVVHVQDAKDLAEVLGELPGSLLYGRSSTNCEAGFTGVAEYIKKHNDTLNNAHVIFISDGNINTDETPRTFDANWKTWATKFGALTVAYSAFEETLYYGENLPEAFETVFGDRFDGLERKEILQKAFVEGAVTEDEFYAFTEQIWTDVYKYSGLNRGEAYPVSDVERAFVKYDKEKGTYIQDAFYYTTFKSAYVTYGDREKRTPAAANALAALDEVNNMYVVDYDSYTSWMDTGITNKKSTFVQSNGIAGLCEALSGALTDLAKTPFNDVVVTDYMSEWVNLDPSTICVVDNSTGEVIWSATEGWKIDEGRPTNAEVPVKVELVNPADYAAGGADVVGNTNGNIYKLTWNVKDGAMLRSDTYSLKYKVTVDTKEDDYVANTDYPANGETHLKYTDENGNNQEESVKVPKVGTGNSSSEPDNEEPEIVIDNDKKRKPKKEEPKVEFEEEDVPLTEMPDIVVEEEVPMPDVVIGDEDIPMAAPEEEPAVLGEEEEVVASTGDSNHMAGAFGGMFAALAGMFGLRKKKED